MGLVCFRVKASNVVNEKLNKKINEAARIHITPAKIRYRVIHKQQDFKEYLKLNTNVKRQNFIVHIKNVKENAERNKIEYNFLIKSLLMDKKIKQPIIVFQQIQNLYFN